MTDAMTGQGKVATLADAVARNVRPGDCLLFAFTHNRAHAAAFEVARQFRDRRCLTLAATGLLEYAAILVAAGTVARLESAFAGGTYPAPSPSRTLQTAVAATADSDPDWTNLTMTLRLMAGAMGWPFVPTHSLRGADLWRHPNRATVADPFSGAETPVIAALRPDVAFIHAPVADTAGNAVIHGPDAEGCWGVHAAQRVVVTADRIVAPEALRKFGPRAGIPGHVVDCVVAAPFGAHPQGQFVWSAAEDVASYAEDYAFRADLRRLSRDPAALRAWVEAWIFAGDHQTYLERLGGERLAALQRAARDGQPAAPTDPTAPASAEERAAALAMGLAEEALATTEIEVLFAGIGLAHLAAWAAESRARDRGLAATLIAETGMIGFRPTAGDPYLFNRPNAASSIFHAGFVETLGVLAGARARRCLALLAAAQIDRSGNINSSRTAAGDLIVGSGGANDLASGAAACLVVMPLKPGRCVDILPFVTSPIRHLHAVATDLGWFVRGADGRLTVAGVVCQPGEERATLARIAQCGFSDIAAAPNLRRRDPPSPDDIALLRRFDPARAILA